MKHDSNKPFCDHFNISQGKNITFNKDKAFFLLTTPGLHIPCNRYEKNNFLILLKYSTLNS